MRRIALFFSLFALLALAFPACDESVPQSSGLREPVRVRGAQFFEGPLPGSAPDSSGPGPKVTAVTLSSRIVLPGQAGKAIDGRVTSDATSVAVRFTDIGSGYWVFVLGSPDVQFPGENDWHGDFDYDSDFAASSPGFHPMRFVGIDANGNAGEQNEVSLCLQPKVPDNDHTCDPTIAPPDAVISLAWDSDVDLDLRVVTPSGDVIDGKHPATMLDDAGAVTPTAGLIDRDSLAGCVKDGRRQEDLVWQKLPAGSTYDVYANLFDACGKPAVDFVVTVYEAEGDGANRNLVATQTAKGHLIAQDANGGAGLGQYLLSYSF